MSKPFDDGQRAWVSNSAKHHLAEHAKLARQCRGAYRGHYAAPANAVAEAHERCAEVWRALLARMADDSR